MTNDQIANMPTRVYLDTRPDRCTTVSGSDLLRKLTVRVAVGSFPLGLIVVIIAADHLDIWHSLLAGVAAYVFVAINLLGVMYTANLFSDRAARPKLGERYGVPARFGTASFQRRRIRIEHAPADIASPVASAMHAIDPSVKITRNEREEVEAMRPGTFLGPTSSRIVAKWEREEDGTVVVIVESSPGELTSAFSPRKDLLYADHGRSLENVEEFQLALRREIETAALAGAGAGEATAPARSGPRGFENTPGGGR